MFTYPDDLVGRELRDRDGRPVGKITARYRYPADVNAPWGAAAIAIRLHRRARLVDLELAKLEGSAVAVPHSRNTISSAPSCTPLIGDTLSDSDAAEVRFHCRGY